MKPLSGCALFGATRALAGIKDALILQHSVVGCQWGTLALRYGGRPYDIRQASTVIHEKEVIDGGTEMLAKALDEAADLFSACGAVFVISGCIPNMIGDDVESVLRNRTLGQRLIHIKAPGYTGNIDSGIETAYAALADLMEPFSGKAERLSINLLGILADDPYAENDVREIRRLLAAKADVNVSLHAATLDGIKNMPKASLNICLGYGETLARIMQAKFGIPYLVTVYPYGIAGMRNFLRKIGIALKIDFSSEIAALEAGGRKLVNRSAEYLQRIYQMPAAVLGDKAHREGMTDFLARELGMQVVLSEDTAEYSLDKFETAADKLAPVLAAGSSFLKAATAKRSIPLLRFVYPLFDKICLSDNTFLGIRGTGYIIEEIVNATLQTDYKADGLYAPLREEICEAELWKK